jgi:thiol-disulfide isomerase/thioredoxin
MPSALLLPLLTCSVVLLVSGAAKLRDAGSVDAAFASMRVPSPLDATWVRRVLPWAEVALGLWLLVATGAGLVLVAFVVLVLFTGYLVLVVRALRGPEPADCGCFGALGDSRVTRVTVWRNALLVLAALLTVVAGFRDVGVLIDLRMDGAWPWVAGAALAAAVAVLVTWRSPSATTAARRAAPLGGGEDDGEYERTAIPRAQVLTEGNHALLLEHEVRLGAHLLVFLSPGCGPCQRIGPLLAGWQDELAPVVVRAVVIGTPDVLHSLPYLRGRAWFDPHGVTRDAFGVGTPSAVLLGTDGELAGGPVAGEEAITEFIEEIAQHLREAAVPEAGEQPELEAVSDDR